MERVFTMAQSVGGAGVYGSQRNKRASNVGWDRLTPSPQAIHDPSTYFSSSSHLWCTLSHFDFLLLVFLLQTQLSHLPLSPFVFFHCRFIPLFISHLSHCCSSFKSFLLSLMPTISSSLSWVPLVCFPRKPTSFSIIPDTISYHRNPYIKMLKI